MPGFSTLAILTLGVGTFFAVEPFCSLQGTEQHPWPPPTRHQKPLLPTHDNPKKSVDISNVSRGSDSLLAKNCWSRPSPSAEDPKTLSQ